MKYVVSAVLAFFFGAVPFAYIVGRVVRHIDIREYGSKNPGAGNVFHLISVKAGLTALAGDMFKGMAALMIIHYLYGFNPTLLTYYGLVAVFGHVYSPFLNFKGGRGAATTLGDFLYILWVAMRFKLILILFLVAIPWAIALYITHSQVVSLAFAFPFFPVYLWFFTHDLSFVIATVIFMFILELFGLKSLKREWKVAYSKYVKRFFEKK